MSSVGQGDGGLRPLEGHAQDDFCGTVMSHPILVIEGLSVVLDSRKGGVNT